MNYNYLVPANSKKQGLVFGLFNGKDLIILTIGIVASFILFFFLNPSRIWSLLVVILPSFIAVFLVFPLPNYHNVRTFFKEMYKFYFVNRRKYIWRGWCYKYEQSDVE